MMLDEDMVVAIRSWLEAACDMRAIQKDEFNEALHRLKPQGVESTDDIADVLQELTLAGELHAGLNAIILMKLRDGDTVENVPPQPWAGELLEELVRRERS